MASNPVVPEVSEISLKTLNLRAGLSLPYVYGSPEYPLVVALTYWLVGPHPLLIVWMNVALATVTVVLGYLIARRVWSVRAGRVARLLGESVKRIHHGDSISSLFI